MQVLPFGIRLQVFKLVIASLLIMFGACREVEPIGNINHKAAVFVPQLAFNLEQAILLNQYSTRSNRTTSWILADSVFIQNATLSSFFDTTSKGKLCILHWTQSNDPVWIGARIPGTFLGADIIAYERERAIIRRYQPNGAFSLANEIYSLEIEELLKQVAALPIYSMGKMCQ